MDTLWSHLLVLNWVLCVCVLQTSSAEALPRAAQGANPAVVGLDEEHHPQPLEAGAAAHKGKALNQHQPAALAMVS